MGERGGGEGRRWGAPVVQHLPHGDCPVPSRSIVRRILLLLLLYLKPFLMLLHLLLLLFHLHLRLLLFLLQLLLLLLQYLLRHLHCRWRNTVRPRCGGSAMPKARHTC